MKRIVELNDQSKQKINFILDNNEIFVFQLYFIDNQIGWFYNIDYENGKKIINGRRLVVAPNVLFQWKNILPFGLFVSSTDGGDPYFQNDFVSIDGGATEPRIQLYVLTKEEVGLVDTQFYAS